MEKGGYITVIVIVSILIIAGLAIFFVQMRTSAKEQLPLEVRDADLLGRSRHIGIDPLRLTLGQGEESTISIYVHNIQEIDTLCDIAILGEQVIDFSNFRTRKELESGKYGHWPVRVFAPPAVEKSTYTYTVSITCDEIIDQEDIFITVK